MKEFRKEQDSQKEKKFTLDVIDNAPESPGIYTWYIKTVLRPADISDKKATRENLLRIANQLKLPCFDIEAKGNLSLLLKGNLQHSHIGSDNGPELSRLIEEVISEEKSRKLFSKILESASPQLMSPLYIGVSKNIKRRLKSHKNDIKRYREIQKTSQEMSVDDFKQKFALEVVKRGIPDRYLEVYVITGFGFSGSENEEKKIYQAVETILNRLFYPIFGRR